MTEIEKLQSKILFEFIKEIKKEFSDQNWDYLDFIAERVLKAASSNTVAPVDNIRWVSADVKPEYNVGVLVFIPDEDFHITSGMWDISNKWVLLDEYRVPDCEVTHWMPLVDIPDEYKKQKEDNEAIMDYLSKHKDVIEKQLRQNEENKRNSFRYPHH